MTKKHFIQLAQAFAAHREEIPADAFRALVADVASICKQSNAAFDKDRFIAACEAAPRNR